jgi:hypothetical protein
MFLNAWGIKQPQHLFPFIAEWAGAVDAFAFQEVFSSRADCVHDGALMNGYEQLVSLLPNHHGLFAPSASEFTYTGPVDFQTFFGLALFIRKGVHIQSYKTSFIAGDYNVPAMVSGKPRGPRNMQGLEIIHNGAPLHIFNLYGLWTGGGKGDCPERFEQTHQILRHVNGTKGAALLGGDFNLEPCTRNIRILEIRGFDNLIKRHQVQNTRSLIHYPKMVRHADYAFTRDTRATDFQVLPAHEVSDHLPLLVTLE